MDNTSIALMLWEQCLNGWRAPKNLHMLIIEGCLPFYSNKPPMLIHYLPNLRFYCLPLASIFCLSIFHHLPKSTSLPPSAILISLRRALSTTHAIQRRRFVGGRGRHAEGHVPVGGRHGGPDVQRAAPLLLAPHQREARRLGADLSIRERPN